MLLTLQAKTSYLQPPENKTPTHIQAAILYIGLYAIATGIGGVKATLAAHGADQLDQRNKSTISSYFSWYFFSICIGGLLASSVMVWVKENCGWRTTFTLLLIVLGFEMCIFVAGFPLYRHKRPSGSALTRIIKVRCTLL